MVRGRMKIGGALGSIVILALCASPAYAIRAVPWIPGRTVVVQLRQGQTTEVIFPSDISQFSNPEAELFSIQFTGARLYVKPTASLSPTRLFATDTAGRSYVIELQEAAEGQREDDSVEISLEVAEGRPAPVAPGPNRLVLDLMKAMRLERPVAGYQVTEKKGELFYEEPKVLQFRLIRVYEGSVMIGYVYEIENMSNGPLRVNPQEFTFKGYVAGSVADMQLAPAEPKDSVEAFKGNPKKTIAYVVVSKAGIRK
ncbi:MAG: type-F conjugative transfer system secretin TraK [Nitrospirae bacterium]|nr:type-F conjugative transfer system secretin TraK [Nitrospirota bacterium]